MRRNAASEGHMVEIESKPLLRLWRGNWHDISKYFDYLKTLAFGEQ
jgi:hypothetical protein